MHLRSVLFVAGKLLNSRRKEKRFAPSIVSMAGIATGVTALITVIGVMNGFQLGFVDDILEISSFHVRIRNPNGAVSNIGSKIRDLDFVRSAVLFAEDQTLVKGPVSEFQACSLKALASDVALRDPRLVEQMGLVNGVFDVSRADGIIIGEELSRRLGTPVGSVVSLLSLRDGIRAGTPATVDLVVVGVFRSGYYEFDKSMAVVGFDAMAGISGDPEVMLGVKLKDRYRDRAAGRVLRGVINDPAVEISTWREYNRAFFSALRVEKLAMSMLLGLIFVVVGFSIFQSMRRTIFERREDIAVLKSLGAPSARIRAVFVTDGCIVGFGGAAIGLLVGLFVSANINGVFAAVEWTINGIMQLTHGVFRWAGTAEVRFFSPMYFYMREIPVRLIFREIVYICAFAAGSAILSAYGASRRISGIQPAQVLRYE